jgi:hypothetical protein
VEAGGEASGILQKSHSSPRAIASWGRGPCAEINLFRHYGQPASEKWGDQRDSNQSEALKPSRSETVDLVEGWFFRTRNEMQQLSGEVKAKTDFLATSWQPFRIILGGDYELVSRASYIAFAET